MDRLHSLHRERVISSDGHGERVDDDVLDRDAVFVGSDPDELLGELQTTVRILRDCLLVIGQRDDGGAVALDQRQDELDALALHRDGIDKGLALIRREAGLECLNDRGVDAQGHIGERLHQAHGIAEEFDLIDQGCAHVDIEHHRAASDLLSDVDLYGGEVFDAQLLLELLAPGRVDALADDAEGLIGPDSHGRARRTEDGVHGTPIPRWCRRRMPPGRARMPGRCADPAQGARVSRRAGSR